MAFAYDLIFETESHLLSGDRETLNVLATSIDEFPSTNTLTLDKDVNTIAAGDYLAVDLEVMFVYSVDIASSTVTVQRGMLGSTIAPHIAGVLVYVNPVNTKWDIFKAINAEIRQLSSPGNGLFGVGTKDLTVDASTVSYALGAISCQKILEVRWDHSGSINEWPKVDRRHVTLMRNMPTSEFAGGLALRIDEPMEPGQTIRVRYATPFSPFSALDDDVSVTGLATSMLDIPPLGAAMRLMGVREAKRGMVERTDSGRRDVGSGAAARSAAVLQQLMQTRIRDEALLLAQQWPN